MATYQDAIDWIARHNGLGSISESYFNTFRGFNHRGAGLPVTYNMDSQGLTFFTRPNLNLSYDNAINDRAFFAIHNDNEASIGRAVLCMLDPKTHRGETGASYGRVDDSKRNADATWLGAGLRSLLVDPRSPFMPLLTNNLISLSGWPDPTLGHYTSDPGVRKEVWSMVDDTIEQFGDFSLTATFRNIAGDPISKLFEIWTRYAAAVYLDDMTPHLDSIVRNTVDYQTRVYRLVLTKDRRYVTKIFACGAAYPLSSALGAAADYSSEKLFVDEVADQITIPFQAVGAMYNDPILMLEFNRLSAMYNPDMVDSVRTTKMKKLDPTVMHKANMNGYPYINLRTEELEWWVYAEDYQTLFTALPVQEDPTGTDLYNQASAVQTVEEPNTTGAVAATSPVRVPTNLTPPATGAAAALQAYPLDDPTK